MEKRYLLFFTLTFLAIFGYAQLNMFLAPPAPETVEESEQAAEESDQLANAETVPEQTEIVSPSKPVEPETDQLEAPAAMDVASPTSVEYLTIGSADPQDPFGLLVVLSSKGATIAEAQLNNPQYRDLGTIENREQYGHSVSGYLGPLIVSDSTNRSGVKLEVIGAGTPAAKARSETQGAVDGLQVNDIVLAINDEQVIDKKTYLDKLGSTLPGETISMLVERETDGESRELRYEIDLEHPRLKILRTESAAFGEISGETMPDHGKAVPASFFLELEQIDSVRIRAGDQKISDLPSLRESVWQITRRPESVDAEQVVEFTMDLDATQLEKIGKKGGLRVVRRYRLVPITETITAQEDGLTAGYHLKMELEFHNLSDSPRDLAYRLDGPTGLPTEGWWYLYKVHPKMFSRAGARDVIWRGQGGHELVGCTEISKNAKENPTNPFLQLNATSPAKFEYAGVDTQYFATVLMPDKDADQQSQPLMLSAAVAMPVGPIHDRRLNLTNVSYRLRSQVTTISANETLKQNFTIFAGPKDPQVLARYELSDIIIYGWFKAVAKLMVTILHGFYWLTTFGGAISGSYALAIVLLTVLVRGCMFPLGRKQAKMAAKMQELAPEMKKIAEQYKNDMEKKSKAQQELFKKHNYNPLSGCLPMVIQLPIFIGLYRSLSVDLELRGAPLFPGLPWCSNLAASDRLFYWGEILPPVLAAPNGWLGPFFNILPLVTIAFFILHQKLFTPPATDEQTRMQHKMMKFMMIFMGFIFFKVAAGLCIYIISSSAWGVAERLLLPKPQSKSADDSVVAEKRSWLTRVVGSNGSSSQAALKKKKKSKGRR